MATIFGPGGELLSAGIALPGSTPFGFPTVVLSSIGGIQLDAVLQETHRFENLVTQYPVESGATITDHIINKPLCLEMDGRLTDTPLSLVASLGAGAAGFGAQGLGGTGVASAAAASAAASALGSITPGASKDAAISLVQLWKQASTFAVITGLAMYVNMTFEHLEFPREPNNGRSIRVRARLRQILTVQSLKVSAATVDPSVAAQAAPTLSKGPVPTQPAQTIPGGS
jgi:hypothetical protein